jgi:hypothetical protein
VLFEDLRQTLGKVMAYPVGGKRSLAPVMKSVQKFIAKLDFKLDTFDLDTMT